MQCSSCGAENLASAKFCSACGVSTSTPPEPIPCPVCRYENPRTAKFCIECGTRLTAAAALATAAAPGVAAPVAPVAGTNETTAVGAPTANPTASATGSTAGSTATPSATAATTRQRDAAQSNPSARTATGAVPRLNTAASMPAEFEQVTRHANLEWKVALLVLVVALGLARWLWSMQNETHQAEMAMSAAFPKGGKAVPASVKTLPLQPTSAPPTPPGNHGEQAAAAAPPAVSQPTMDTAMVTPVTVEAPSAADTKPKKTKKPGNQGPKKAEEPITQRRLAEVERTPADSVPEPPRTVPNSTRGKVAECRQLPLFPRERCMWSICDGRWGKDGCPSY